MAQTQSLVSSKFAWGRDGRGHLGRWAWKDGPVQVRGGVCSKDRSREQRPRGRKAHVLPEALCNHLCVQVRRSQCREAGSGLRRPPSCGSGLYPTGRCQQGLTCPICPAHVHVSQHRGPCCKWFLSDYNKEQTDSRPAVSVASSATGRPLSPHSLFASSGTVGKDFMHLGGVLV